MSEEATRAPKPPGLFSRGETSSRRVSLMIAAGMVAYVAGTYASSLIIARLVEAEQPVSLTVEWLIVRLWLLVVLPLLAWPIGRFGIGDPLTFGLVGPLSAELFDVLKVSASSGLEGVFPTTEDTVARTVTLLAGMVLNTAVAYRGAQAADRAVAAAEALAVEQAKAHAEKLGAPPPQAGPGASAAPATPAEPGAPAADRPPGPGAGGPT